MSKGSKPRNNYSKQFRDNYEEIDWGNDRIISKPNAAIEIKEIPIPPSIQKAISEGLEFGPDYFKHGRNRDIQGADLAFNEPVVRVTPETPCRCRRCKRNDVPMKDMAVFAWRGIFVGVCKTCIKEDV